MIMTNFRYLLALHQHQTDTLHKIDFQNVCVQVLTSLRCEPILKNDEIVSIFCKKLVTVVARIQLWGFVLQCESFLKMQICSNIRNAK